MIKQTNQVLNLLIPMVIVSVAAAVRFYGIDVASITQDESTMVLFAQGILEKGYPFIRQGDSEFLISTYELVPYPIALSIYLFGFSEMAIRVPAMLFSMATALLIYYFGRHLFGRRVGILAALLFAILPWAIYWGRNGFYPAQAQFFVLLAVMAMYRILSDPHVPSKWYYLTGLTLILSYLTWEGSGILLPILFSITIILRWRQPYWITNIHAWTAVSLVTLVVIGQLAYRLLLRETYVQIGSSRADVSFLQPAFNNPDYDPFYYVLNLFIESHLLLALFIVVGLLFIQGNWRLRFLYLFVIMTFFFLTCLLGYYALRYVYMTLPILLIIASASAVILLDTLVNNVMRLLRSTYRPKALPIYFVFITALLGFVSPWGIQPHLLERSAKATPIELRYGAHGFGFKSVVKDLEQLYRPGDIIIAQAPFPLRVYTGLNGDYFLQSITATPISYDRNTFPYYADKWVHNPVLRNKEELQDVLYRNARVWIVLVPYGATRHMLGDDMTEFLDNNTMLMTDTPEGKLFLWENPSIRPHYEYPNIGKTADAPPRIAAQ